MSQRLAVDPLRCSAHRMCAEILPERVTLDDWGYPVIDGEPVSPELTALARRAVDACPAMALKLRSPPAERAERRPRQPRSGRSVRT